MEYRIDIDKVNIKTTNPTINPAYHSVPKRWVGKFLVTIWKSVGKNNYLSQIIQEPFDTPKEAIEFATKFKKSRRKNTIITFNNNLSNDIIG